MINSTINENNKNLESRSTTLNNNIYNILILTFIFSILSIFIALIIISISMNSSPLPTFPFLMTEHMWKFYLVLPLPLSSFILGLIFVGKGYKCKKNIIAGVIFSILLIIYGSFTKIFSNHISHDISYLNELSEQINIDFPEDAYIAISYDHFENCESLAMVKFNSNDFDSVVLNNIYWNKMKELPTYFGDSLLRSLTYDYDYFLTFNPRTNTYGTFNDGLIFLSYDIESNILFICKFK